MPMSSLEAWKPVTRVGLMVKAGSIGSLADIYTQNLPLKEPEIVDHFLPGIKHEIINVSLVQKQTDAGEISRFKVAVMAGNELGYAGLGMGKARQIRFAIDLGLADAKLNVVPLRRGCGSWECTCGREHSVPFTVIGRAGSVTVELMPAPLGIGIVAGDIAKVVLKLAGIQDVWTRTRGETRTPLNFAKATFEALKATTALRNIAA